MSAVATLRSFHRRRIAIPVGPDALVLDVGSGDKPHWRADVLLDRYVDADHAVQRSGRGAARVDRPLFDADAAAMPFADGAFDYVVCSHMLEHVLDPAAVISEMTRVAKAGYIEVPEAASAKIVDFPSHLWWCTLDAGVLTFTAKQHPWFDPDIDRYLTDSGLREPVARLLDRHLDHRVIELRWTGTVPHRVVGEPSPELLARIAAEPVRHRSGQQVVAKALTAALTLPQRRHRRTVRFDDVVAPPLRTGTGEVLTRRVYRVGGA